MINKMKNSNSKIKNGGGNMNKKMIILDEVKNRPFQLMREVAEKANSTEDYVRTVIRNNEIDLRIERTAKYLNQKQQYAKLAKRHTDALIKIDELEDEDRLAELFNLQKTFQNRLSGVDLPAMKPDKIPMAVTSLIAEVGEILECQQRWKDWKKDFEEIDYNNLTMEIADMWHFVINLTLFLNMDADDLYQEFSVKNKINHDRQDSNY